MRFDGRQKELCETFEWYGPHLAWLGYEVGFDSKKADLRSADLRSADLNYADLRNADLRNADLRNADLNYADLRSANLRLANLRSADFWHDCIGTAKTKIIQVSNVGSENGVLVIATNCEGGKTFVSRGCFRGTKKDFLKAVEDKHGDNVHGVQYRKLMEVLC